MKTQIGMMVLLAGVALAQPPQGAGQGGPPPSQPGPGGPQQQGAPAPAGRGAGRGGQQQAPPAPRANRPPLERRLMPGLPGRWWDNPQMVQKLTLTADQQKKMDDIFQANRMKLVDLNATMQKEELTMEPLVAADQPDETKILGQIDKVAQARAELEKANARFLLGIRRLLTADQWKKLQAEHPEGGPGGRGPGGGGPGGPGGGPQQGQRPGR